MQSQGQHQQIYASNQNCTINIYSQEDHSIGLFKIFSNQRTKINIFPNEISDEQQQQQKKLSLEGFENEQKFLISSNQNCDINIYASESTLAFQYQLSSNQNCNINIYTFGQKFQISSNQSCHFNIYTSKSANAQQFQVEGNQNSKINFYPLDHSQQQVLKLELQNNKFAIAKQPNQNQIAQK